MFFDPLYFVFIGPGIALSLWASFKTKSAFKKYSAVRTRSGVSGAQAAQRLLDTAGISDVEIVRTPGALSDHYNPMTKKLALSEPVYAANSVAAVGVACHEAGHAIQHAREYKPLWFRSWLVPIANFGARFWFFPIMLSYFLGSQGLFDLGLIMFSAMVVFQLVTLPVEFDASARAKRLAPELGIIDGDEIEGVNKVLNAAALTYVAAALTALLQLIYFFIRRD